MKNLYTQFVHSMLVKLADGPRTIRDVVAPLVVFDLYVVGVDEGFGFW